jgi:hypothetical protein
MSGGCRISCCTLRGRRDWSCNLRHVLLNHRTYLTLTRSLLFCLLCPTIWPPLRNGASMLMCVTSRASHIQSKVETVKHYGETLVGQLWIIGELARVNDSL